MPTPTPTPTPWPPSCLQPSASVSPVVVARGQVTTFAAQGFAPGSRVLLSIDGPSPTQPVTETANARCGVQQRIGFSPNDHPGTYTVVAEGQDIRGGPLRLTARFTLAPEPTSTPQPVE